MTGKIGLTSAGAMIAVLLMLLGIFAVPAPASAATTNLSDKLTTESGPTVILGGGNHFFVKFGSDAAFGVVWGTEQTPNNVYFVAVKARYLGVAQVYDNEGNLVEANHTIKIATLYAVKLDDILEFNDSGSDGIFQGYRVYSNGNFTGNYKHIEQLYKKVDLNTSWTASPVTEESTDDSKAWSFGLSANDLPYVPFSPPAGNYTGPTGDDKLNNLTLTFHLEATMVKVDNVSVPQWRITVNRGMMGQMWWMTNIQQMDPMLYSGKMITYHVKWDQMIQGWDNDSADANPALLMEFQAIVGNYIPPALVSAMHMATLSYAWMIANMNENGRMICRVNTGDTAVNESTGTYTAPKPLATPTLTFGGDNTRIGRFEWVSNVTVDGIQKQLHAQLMGGVPIFAIGQNGALFGGFAVLGGIAFPGGGTIVHDPLFSSEAYVDLDTGSEPQFPGFILVIGMVAVAVVVIAVLAFVMMDRKPGQKTPQNYERSMNTQQVDWSKYYKK